MQRWIYIALVGLAVGESASSTLAAEGLRQPKRPMPSARPARSRVPLGEYLQWPKEVSASPAQKEKFDLLKQAYLPQLEVLHERLDAIYTNERRQAENAAIKAAKAAGLSREEMQAAALAALQLTPDEAEKLSMVRQSLGQMKQQIRTDVLALLTSEQLSLIPKDRADQRPTYRGPLSGFVKQLLRGVTLSPEQQTKLDEAIAGFTPIYQAEVNDAMAAVWTNERKAEHAASIKAAIEAGKSKREIAALEASPTVLNDDERARLAAAREAQTRLQSSLRERILELLTPEQRAQVEGPPQKNRK